MQPNDEVRIETPEHIEFSYELAGIGTRFVAALLDSLLQSLFLLVLLLTVLLLASFQTAAHGTRELLMVLYLVASFLIVWGYHVYYESTWNGQTPGKRAAMIRVIRDDGTPVAFLDVVVRNLVRVVDFLPAFYALGVVSILSTRLSKRLGDLASGTIVVRERADEVPTLPEEPAAEPEPGAELDAPVGLDVHRLERSQLEMIQRFLERRHELAPEVRAEFAQRLVAGVAARVHLPTQPVGLEQCEALLEAIDRQRRWTL